MTIVIAYMVGNGMSIKREKNNLTFSKKKNIMTSERVAKLRKSSFATRFCSVRLAAHVSNGLKSRIRPVVGRI